MPGNELSAAGDEILPSLFTETPQLTYLAGNIFGGGMVLGATSTGGDVMIELIRAVPTRIALLCEDPWLARLVTVRVAGMGANAVIATDRATAWEHFVNVIGGQRPIATVRTDHASALAGPQHRGAAGGHRGHPRRRAGDLRAAHGLADHGARAGQRERAVTDPGRLLACRAGVPTRPRCRDRGVDGAGPGRERSGHGRRRSAITRCW